MAEPEKPSRSPVRDLSEFLSEKIESPITRAHVDEYIYTKISPFKLLKKTLIAVLVKNPKITKAHYKKMEKLADDGDKTKTWKYLDELVKNIVSIDVKERVAKCRRGTIKNVLEPYKNAKNEEELKEYFATQRSCKLKSFSKWMTKKNKAEQKKKEAERKKKEAFL